MPFKLFNKKKKLKVIKSAVPPQEETEQEKTTITPEAKQQQTVTASKNLEQESNIETQNLAQKTITHQAEQKQEVNEKVNKTYLKAMPLHELSDIEKIKTEVKNGNIVILRVTPLASKSIEDVKSAVNDLFQFSESVGGDIARLGEERIVLCPKSTRIWREKTSAHASNEPLPTVV